MTAFDPILISFTLLAIAAALYLPIIFFAILRRAGQEITAGLIILYALIGAGLGIFEAFWRGGRLSQLDTLAFGDVEVYGALILTFLMTITVRVFMRRSPIGWLIVGGVVGIALVILLNQEMQFPRVIWSSGNLILTNDRLGVMGAVVGWLVFMIGAAFAVAVAYQKSRQPLFRNRLVYWIPTFILISINDGLILAGVNLPGNPLRLLATALMGYLALTHDLPDVRQIMRRILVYLITIFFIMTFYLLGVSFVEAIFRALPYFNPLFLGAVFALLLAILFTPLLSLVRRLVDAWLHIDQYDAGRTLQEYSESISNILEMERLAGVAVGVIMKNMRVQRGFLFLVDQKRDVNGIQAYRLRPVQSVEERQIVSIDLAENGPLASHFMQDGRPLLQYDIDLLPAFRATSPIERDWFDSLECEVYVPISSKKQWIGMLAFGAKLSGHRYTGNDLVTLSALGNQTAVALENARLVDNLMRLNEELRRARRELEDTNRALERLDRTKSDFISVASHELRTPLTVIKGYVEMLLENPSTDPEVQKFVKGINDGTTRLHEIMDSMFEIAQIDARSLQLHLQQIDLGDVIQEVCQTLSRTARDRKLTLSVDLPVLPVLKADPDSLRKVFQHLVNNAIKFTPDGGKVTITGHVVDARPNDLPEGGVEIVVSDTGVGVDPNFRELIFTKFYQAGDLTKHSTSKSRFKGGGSGLGLALSKGIVEAHRGRIWVESPGYDEVHFPGSRFHVLIPSTQIAEGESLKMSAPVKINL
ncbi:MAG TPA: ATP-binding protein [Anaerolineales bacterium]|nr:ATP-binding protein [Anaerolineales bacterium]